LGYGKDETYAFDQYVKKYISPIYAELKQNYAKEFGFDILPYMYDVSQIYNELAVVKQELIDDQNKYYEVMLDVIEKVSPEAGGIINTLDTLSLIDVATDANKIPGGYTTLLRGINQPFVFSYQLDANVAVHEFGHAVNMYETANCAELLVQELFDTAYLEIHSSTMEVLSMKYFDDIFENADGAKKAWIFDMLVEITETAMFDELQKYIYTTDNITFDMINAEYIKLREEYLGAVDYEPFTSIKDGLNWIYDSHAFTDPFYSVQYGVATTVSLEFYELSLDDYDAAVEKYLKLCKLDYNYDLPEALSACGLGNVFSEETVEGAGGIFRAMLID
jgi:oligoendopeptidase F